MELHIATDILQGIGAIIITGSSGAAVIDLTYAACKRQFNNRLEPVRLQLAQRLVLALEFLIGADILSSLHTPTLKDVALLVAIIGMRTVLSLSISYELRHPYSPPDSTKSNLASQGKSVD
jgi:uncharacterized membrane protein